MQQSSIQYGKVSSIYPHYKPNDVFARDQAYYDQLLNNTRRNQNQNSNLSVQASQQVTYQPVQTQYQQNRPSQTNINYNQQVEDTVFMNQSFGPHSTSQQQQINQAAYNLIPTNQKSELGYGPALQQQHLKSLEQNKKLKQKLDDLINFRDQKDQGSQIIKKHHYNTDSQQGKLISQQQIQIKNLLQQIKTNNIDINKFKNAILELQKSMNNIQSVDREIYKQLKSLTNRDQDLLDKATAALARGAGRQEIAEILERIIA